MLKFLDGCKTANLLNYIFLNIQNGHIIKAEHYLMHQLKHVYLFKPYYFILVKKLYKLSY